ncbi:MAG: sensor domain-containing diguanylate cyclase [Candidatus Eisenbacteria bacterium]|nr:sensor domain-containing diguanylate cyclase [Candidatus Eisenbacteria bacterium]
MKNKNTDYRRLLEEVLPVHLLGEGARRLVEESLGDESPRRLWETANLVLERLAARGFFVRGRENSDGVVYHDRRSLLKVVLRPPEKTAPDYAFRFRPLLTASYAAEGKGESLESVLTGVATRASEEDLGDALRKIAEYLRRALDPERVRFLTLDGEDPVPGLFDSWRTSRITEHFRDHLLAGGEPLYIPDLGADEDLREWARREGLGSAAVLPLRAGEEIFGVLEVHHAAVHPFGEEELGVLSLLAMLAAGRIRNARDLEKLIYVDILTGVFSRRFFEQQVLREVERANRESLFLALVMVDLDNFKQVNDRYGHLVGDTVLTRVARILQENVRKIDMVTRYGGEEFAILLPGASREQAKVICERLRSLVEDLPVPEPGHAEFRLTTSLGVSLYPDHAGETADPDTVRRELLQRSDQALYEAKRLGKNRVVFWNDSHART